VAETEAKNIIFFDGVCNLCNSSVRFLYKRTEPDAFEYHSLQSEFAEEMLNKFNIPAENLSSVVLVENDKVYTHSTAALRAAKYMKGIYPLLYGFIIVPRFIRDGVYNFIARNRYKWFGKQDEVCEFDPNFNARNAR